MSKQSVRQQDTKSKSGATPAAGLKVRPVSEVARLWNMNVRKCVDALRAHGVRIVRAPGTTVALVYDLDLERLFTEQARDDETHLDTILRVTAEPLTADDVLASVGLRRRAS